MQHKYESIKSWYSVVNTKTNEDYQKEFAENFFYANLCQFCSIFNPLESVKRCVNCDAMFYCSPEHIKAHRKEHKQLCGVLHKFKINAKKKYLFEGCNMGELERCFQFIDMAETELKRRLKPYEKSMFLYPRICLTCCESNPKVVKSCEVCPHANFCTKHFGNFVSHALTACSLFKFSFHMDEHWLVFKDLPLELFVYAFPININHLDLPKDNEAVMEKLVIPYHPRIDFSQQGVKITVSTVFARTLTLVYALKRLNLTLSSDLVVHVICKRNQEEKNFVEWELILHRLRKVRYLEVCFIGYLEKKKLRRRVTLCRACRTKILMIETSSLDCKEYYNNSHKTPNVIVSYDVDINTHPAFEGASQLLSAMKIPIVLTAKHLNFLNDEVVNAFVADPENFSDLEENPFEEMRTMRLFKYIATSNHLIRFYSHPRINEVLHPVRPIIDSRDYTTRDLSKIVNLVDVLREKKNANKYLKNEVQEYEDSIQREKIRNNVIIRDFQDIVKKFQAATIAMEKKVLRVLQFTQILKKVDNKGRNVE